ncbi:MAG: helix-turn-helix domain-containing protein [Lapillicoccus sp.]
MAASAADPLLLVADGIRSLVTLLPTRSSGPGGRRGPDHRSPRDALVASVRDDVGAGVAVLLSVGLRDGEVVVSGPDLDAGAALLLRHHVRHTAAPDRFLGGFLIGRTACTTAQRAVGGAAWASSPLHRVCRDGLGVDHLLGMPMARSESQIDLLLLGRQGEDFSEAMLALLTRAQASLLDLYRLAARPGPGEQPHLGRAGVRAVMDGATPLTPREREVLGALGTGRTAYAIAATLGCSERTVHRHLQSIYRKLGTHDRRVTLTRARELRLI